ncbi:MAG TPA: glycoside hydrolase family 92 protein, partial [Candidatus Dormibacteraeota bacterium]|nr:glycoside hydrolase family 92 protein [Candidatus Dormibacteraeota bacterium]
ESAARPFAQLRASAAQRWRAELGKIDVSGGSPRLRTLFYTALYHALIEPSTVSDADGSYLGMDGRVHRAGHAVQYTDISGWDVYRTQVPLLAMLEPQRAADLATSLSNDARQSGCLPRWPYANQQTNAMTGDPSDALIASIYAFGARSFDAASALARMVAGATGACRTHNGDYTEREGVRDYAHLGYIPLEDNTDVVGHTLGSRQLAWGTAATTLEDALADSTVSDLATRLGRHAIARRFARRGENWQRLFERRSGYIRPRWRSGGWLSPFDPTSQTAFVEGNAVQYTWLVPQDPDRLFSLVGGRSVARRRLDRFFARLNSGPSRPYAFLGNEPSLATPWLYDWLGEPARASATVRRALLGLYSPTPGGMPGNDDGGTLSSWWVFGAIGLFPAVPGTDLLAINAPLFSRAVVRLPRGHLVIDAARASRARPYIQAAALDDRRLRKSRIHFDSLIAGVHRLDYSMGADSDSSWARRG